MSASVHPLGDLGQKDGKTRARMRDEDLASLIIQFDGTDEGHASNLAEIAMRMQGAGLTVIDAFRGVKEMSGDQSVFIRVFAPMRRLLVQAEKVGFLFRLNSSALRDADISLNRSLIAQGVVFSASVGHVEYDDTDLAIPPDRREGCADAYDPYSYCFGPYTGKPELYHLYSINKSTGTILSQAAAIKLLIDIIETPMEDGGANVDLDGLVLHQYATAWFPKTEPELVCKRDMVPKADSLGVQVGTFLRFEHTETRARCFLDAILSGAMGSTPHAN
jgi:hypothetical protein